MAFRLLITLQRRMCSASSTGSTCSKGSTKETITPFKRFCYNLSGFNKYGLMRDDCLDDMSNEDVQIAIKRLPNKIQDERNYRILRAIQLDIQKDILPKEQWTKIEDDVLYLTPIVNEVIKEREEREKWELEQ